MFALFFHGRLSEVQICFNYSTTTTPAFATGCDSNSDTSLWTLQQQQPTHILWGGPLEAKKKINILKS